MRSEQPRLTISPLQLQYMFMCSRGETFLHKLQLLVHGQHRFPSWMWSLKTTCASYTTDLDTQLYRQNQTTKVSSTTRETRGGGWVMLTRTNSSHRMKELEKGRSIKRRNISTTYKTKMTVVCTVPLFTNPATQTANKRDTRKECLSQSSGKQTRVRKCSVSI